MNMLYLMEIKGRRWDRTETSQHEINKYLNLTDIIIHNILGT